MWKHRITSVIVLVLVGFVGTCHAVAPLVAAAAVTGISSLVGSGIGAWFNYAGMNKQLAENQRAEAVSIKREDAAIARSEKWAGKNLRLQKKQLGMQETRMDRDHATETRAKLMNWVASNNQRANNMISIWRGRG